MGSSGGFFPKQSLRRGHQVRARDWGYWRSKGSYISQGLPRSQGNCSQNHPPKHRGWGHWHFRFPSEAPMPQFSWATSAHTSSHQRRPQDKGGKDAERMPGTEHELLILAGTSCPHLHTEPPLHLLGWSFATWESWVLGHKVPELPATQSEGGMSAFFSWSRFPCINFFFSSFIEIELTYDINDLTYRHHEMVSTV